MNSMTDKEACPFPGMDTIYLNIYYIMSRIQQKIMKQNRAKKKKKSHFQELKQSK